MMIGSQRYPTFIAFDPLKMKMSTRDALCPQGVLPPMLATTAVYWESMWPDIKTAHIWLYVLIASP